MTEQPGNAATVRLIAAARTMIELAMSRLETNAGDTVTLVVPADGLALPEEIGQAMAEVGAATGFAVGHTSGSSSFTLTRTNFPAVRPRETSIGDLTKAVADLVDLQRAALDSRGGWTRDQVIAALAFLLALVSIVLDHTPR